MMLINNAINFNNLKMFRAKRRSLLLLEVGISVQIYSSRDLHNVVVQSGGAGVLMIEVFGYLNN